MRIGRFSFWTSEREAAGYGCTHHGRFFGLVPGFMGMVDGVIMWVPRSDLLTPVEDALCWLMRLVCLAEGREPGFLFRSGKPLPDFEDRTAQAG